jgi:2',3'-cyclic-nucleotide 2'-phosphodiesterase (5'-nucleotidase family)
VQCEGFYHDIGKMRFTSDAGTVKFLDWSSIHLDNLIPEDPIIAAEIDSLNLSIDQYYPAPLMAQKVATVASDCAEVATNLDHGGIHDTPVGNLVTDAFRAMMNTDIAVTAGGSTAQPLYAGPIVGNDVMRMIGYGYNLTDGLGYKLATFTVLGQAIRAGLQFGLNSIPSDEFFLQVSGMIYTYGLMETQTPYIVLGEVTIGGVTLNAQRTYTVTANEFTLRFFQTLLKSLGMTQPINVMVHDTTEFAAVLAFVKNLQTVSYKTEGRIHGLEVGVQDAPLAGTFSISHYPNPASSSVTFSYSVPAAAFVNLKIFNMYGQEVAVVVEQQSAPGAFMKSFNVSAFIPGLYTYRFQSNGGSVSGKLLIVH